jgi:vanillate O-demethylase monooxygenase subunit
MYPLSTSEQFATNHWYIAAWSSEISRTPLSRQLLGKPVMFYRSEAGAVIAMSDLCPHRRFPLSKGKLLGDKVQCQYHGFTFGPDGACVRIPAQERVPPKHRVRTFPVVEKWAWVWIWMGDPELADPALIPDHDLLYVENDEWCPVIGGREYLKARYAIVHENLLDLSHLSFLHETTIGSPNIATTEMNVEEKDGYLEIARYIRSDTVENVPLAKALKMSGLVDRTMIQQFFAPSLHVTGSNFSSAQEGGENPGYAYGSTRVIHAITPETETSTHYFWAFSRNFVIEDDELSKGIHKITYAAIEEDIFASEAIEANLNGASNPADDLHCRADAAALRGRVMIERLIAKENAEPEASEHLRVVNAS